MAECIAEIWRETFPTPSRTIWHLAGGPANEDATWQPIRCGEGVVMPGNTYDREPTCPDCWRIFTLEKAGRDPSLGSGGPVAHG